MPTLLETQRAIALSLVAGGDTAAGDFIVADGLAAEARLDVYRNTFIGGATTALRLTFPAIHRLVGAAFFESAARLFIEATPPRRAYLDDYGEGFPAFLEAFEPAAPLAYLPGIARLEWAVSRALHAPDVDALDVSRLAKIDPQAQGGIVFAPHPSVGLVRADHPIDEIWNAVLAGDDAAMAAIDLDAGPVALLVHRGTSGLEVRRMKEPEWRFMSALCAGRSLQDAIDSVPGIDPAASLAEHFAAGRFSGFDLVDENSLAIQEEIAQ